MENFLERLKPLSSAEDFLQFFGVPFDPVVVNVSRLHILKRFFQYLQQEKSLQSTDEVWLFSAYRSLLARAYADFVQSTPAQEKVFKVLQDTHGKQHVALESVRRSMPSRTAA